LSLCAGGREIVARRTAFALTNDPTSSREPVVAIALSVAVPCGCPSTIKAIRMITVLHAVALAEWCFLSELLYWVALTRFPLAIDDLEGGEFRFSRECELHSSWTIASPVSYSERELAGLRPNPRYTAFIEGRGADDAKFLANMKDYIEALFGTDREYLVARRQEALAELKDIGEWDTDFNIFLEYFKSKIFFDLRDGKIITEGIKLNGTNTEASDANIKKDNIVLEELGFFSIDQRQWVYSKIDWENSILYGTESSYCWIRFEVESMLSTYSVPELPALGTATKLCDTYILESLFGNIRLDCIAFAA